MDFESPDVNEQDSLGVDLGELIGRQRRYRASRR